MNRMLWTRKIHETLITQLWESDRDERKREKNELNKRRQSKRWNKPVHKVYKIHSTQFQTKNFILHT